MEESVFDEMIARYSPVTPAEKKKVHHKVMQELVLVGLYKSGFFDEAAFCGDSCLCLLHDLQRLSGDLNFSLLRADEDFHMEHYLNAIRTEFRISGQRIIIEQDKRKDICCAESSFLKDNTTIYNLSFSNRDRIQLELDTQPPGVFATENRKLYLPIPSMVRCYKLPDLYACKMYVFLFRKQQYYIRGRDWYDFEWFVRNGVMLNFDHLQQRAEQLNFIQPKDFTPDSFKDLLRKKILNMDVDTDMSLIRKDIRSLIKNPTETAAWSMEYFLQLVDMINFK